jgi:tetratricopeptide (TPR) repeat protein
MKTAFAALLLVSIGWGVARADEVSSAKAHYLRATSHFAVGEFDDAARDYETAYKLHPDPALLFDAAQAHRLAGHHEKALLLYRSYVRMYPTGASANSCKEQIARLTVAISADQKAKSSPPTGTTEPAPPVMEPKAPEPAQAETTPPPQPQPQPQPHAAPPQPAVTTTAREQRPIHKKWWLWTAVGGAAVAAVVITVAVVETRGSGNSFSNVPDIGPRAPMLLKISWGAAR